MDQGEYDEFGNFIGTEPEPTPLIDQEPAPLADTITQVPQVGTMFRSAQDTFGPFVQVVLGDRDTMTLEEPIIMDEQKSKKHYIRESSLSDAPYSDEHLRNCTLYRHFAVALVGAMHSGKSSLAQLLIEGSFGETASDTTLFMDSHELEAARRITLFMKPMTIILKPSYSGPSHSITLLDSPGHLDFVHDQQCIIDYAEVVIVCVDAVEGLNGLMSAEETFTMVREVVNDKKVILFINKIDRLILECKLTPTDCYHKLKHIIDSANTLLGRVAYFNPIDNNVVFGSTRHKWMFTLESFLSRMYNTDFMIPIEFMFGDVMTSRDRDGDLAVSPYTMGGKRTFVEYILEPIYKAYTSSLDDDNLKEKCKNGRRKDKDCKWDSIIRRSVSNLIGWDCDFLFPIVDDYIADGIQSTLVIAQRTVFVDKEFGFLLKVQSGTVNIGQVLQLQSHLEKSSITNVTVKRMFLCQAGRRLVPIKTATRGNIIFMPLSIFTEPPSDSMFILYDTEPESSDLLVRFEKRRQFRPVVCRVGVEPLQPHQLPLLQSMLKKALLLFSSLCLHVEETGEHCLTGPGELYMDTVLSVLRSGQLESPVEFRVSDPFVQFCETVIDQSTVTCFADSPNGSITVCVICEPMETGLVDAIERGNLFSSAFHNGIGFDEMAMARIGAVLRDQFKWDVLSARSIMAVAPDPLFGTNLLLYDILDPTVSLPDNLKEWCIQGFQWACRQGPLVESLIRAVKFRLVNVTVNDPKTLSAGQVIPTMRRACFAAMVTATCKLMEPVLEWEIVVWGGGGDKNQDCRQVVSEVVSKRRGHVQSDVPIPGTPWYLIRALIPAIDSFGVEVDLRIACQGLATVQSRLHHWQPVPGDPMDNTIKVPPLTAAPAPYMSRDFINKTRRRKGLAEDVLVERFLDDLMLKALAALDI